MICFQFKRLNCILYWPQQTYIATRCNRNSKTQIKFSTFALHNCTITDFGANFTSALPTMPSHFLRMQCLLMGNFTRDLIIHITITIIVLFTFISFYVFRMKNEWFFNDASDFVWFCYESFIIIVIV